MDVQEINKIIAFAMSGKPFKETGLPKEQEDFFNRVSEDIDKAPEGAYVSLPNEWIGDEYDDLIESFKRVGKIAKAKRIGSYAISKAEGEKRYTLGAMYIPDMEDAHGEWTSSDELQRAVWDYVRSNDRRIRLQHERDVVAGEWVEVMTFPYSLTVPIKTAEGEEKEHTYPPNTVFLGVIWEPWAWKMVTEGKIRGYSIGGKAERLFVDMEVDKNDPTVSDVHVDTIMNPAKKKPKKVETV